MKLNFRISLVTIILRIGCERINMCNRCNYNSSGNQIYKDPLTNEYYLDIETSEWDEHDDEFVHQKEYIAYCP